MDQFRRVSANDSEESVEVNVSGAIKNPDDSYSISMGDIKSWPEECDFITYARDEQGKVDEETRVVWSGTKDDDTNVTANRTGGSDSYVPGGTDYATVVPTHKWANDLVDGVASSLPQDGNKGLLQAGTGLPLVFVVSATQPAAVAGRVVVWLRPLE